MLQFGMASHYKLLFRGAVHADQHASVVRPRLQAMLKASDAQMEVMFSGKAVTIKKSVDEATAEKYVDAFFKAGAKLELVEAAAPAAPAEGAPYSGDSSVPDKSVPDKSKNEPASNSDAPTDAVGNDETSGFQLAAVGTNLVEAADRPVDVAPAVATDHLSLANPGTRLGSEPGTSELDAAPVVDTSHLQLDQPGVRLGEPENDATATTQLLNLNFELGEVGEVLVESSPTEDPVLPDLSHLQLEVVAAGSDDSDD